MSYLPKICFDYSSIIITMSYFNHNHYSLKLFYFKLYCLRIIRFITKLFLSSIPPYPLIT